MLHSFLLLGLWLLTTWAQAADIRAALDRNPVGLNESFQITYTADAEPDGNPDFSPLRENFDILNQQRSSNSSWVNGKSSRTEQWTLQLMAKQAGEWLVPPIAFGDDRSQPLKIVVNEASAEPNSDADLFLEVSVTPDKPYVQSQVLYTLKLYRRVQIVQASLGEPEIKDALVEKLGEDSTYTTQIQGVDYWVTERKYALFPQQSGVFTIAPLNLTAEVVSQQRPRFNGFFNRQATETRRISSKPVTLSVQPVPDSFKDGSWLAAESLQLTQSWSDPSLQAKVGEPLTRTVTLIAQGATVGQLPELASKVGIDGVKTYPDQPLLKEDKHIDGLVAKREEKVAFIPSKPGRYELPGLEIRWFNTKTGKVEIARLPSAQLTALAASGADQPREPQSQPAPIASNETLPPEVGVVSNQETRFWQAISAALAAGWLVTGVWLYRRRVAPAIKPAGSAPVAESTVDKNLKRACCDNNPQVAKQALLEWGRLRFGVDSLGALAGKCPSGLASEITDLNRLLYSGQKADWQGKSLWTAYAAFTTEKVAKPVDDALEPLYRI